MFQNFAAAPDGGGNHFTAAEALAIVGILIFRGLLAKNMPPKKQLADRLGHKSANWLGTVLGAGQDGKGPRLWKDSKGEIRLVLENARVAAWCQPKDVQAALVEREIIDDHDDLNDPAVQAKIETALEKLLPRAAT